MASLLKHLPFFRGDQHSISGKGGDAIKLEECSCFGSHVSGAFLNVTGMDYTLT